MKSPSTKHPYFLLLLLSLIIGFWLRWRFAQTVNLYPDEFVTLLAMDMIRQRGAPILPSGLFYEHGLLYSYLAGGISLLGDPVLLGRGTSLVCGLLAIGLTYRLGGRWFSPTAGALAAFGLALAPDAIAWGGRVRMYALLHLLVLLTLGLMLEGLYRNRLKSAWLSVVTYSGALLTQFVSLVLLPPISLAEIIGLQTRPEHRGWYAQPHLWLRGMAVGGAVLAAMLIKRAGQPKGIDPLTSENIAGGVWQVLTIYSSLSFNVAESWAAIAPFFSDWPVLVYAIFAPVGVVVSLWRKPRYQPAVFLALVLILTTLEIIFLAPADRRDEKYLFMLLPGLLLLGGHGLALGISGVSGLLRRSESLGLHIALVVPLMLGLGLTARSDIEDVLADVGEDYESAFTYVAAHRQPGEAILSGTPAAAYHYLGRNDYYAVQASMDRYAYRILYRPDGPGVERWLGSPWLNTAAAVNAAFSQQPVWLVLERWGLLVEYYDSLFRQNLLAQTEFIREDNGIIVLKSLPGARLLVENPAVPGEALLNGTEGDPGQLVLHGYTLEGKRLTLYWEALSPVVFDYTVFINLQNDAGETLHQTDHRPLGSIYPTTLWSPGELIRETSQLDLPAGQYHLRVGMYRLETGERLWVPSDETMQNMVYLGVISVVEE